MNNLGKEKTSKHKTSCDCNRVYEANLMLACILGFALVLLVVYTLGGAVGKIVVFVGLIIEANILALYFVGLLFIKHAKRCPCSQIAGTPWWKDR